MNGLGSRRRGVRSEGGHVVDALGCSMWELYVNAGRVRFRKGSALV